MGRDRALSAVPVALAALLLTGCGAGPGTGGDDPGAGTKAGASTATGAKTAAKGATLGGADSPCPLPVTFDTAADWQAKKVKKIEDPDFAELNSILEQGTVTVVCEIDAKPAGHIGFLRVWTGERTDDSTPRAVLEAFVGDEKDPKSVTYRDVKAGALPAGEVTYTIISELLDEPKKKRALAVATESGPVVLDLGGMDSDEHDTMLPAYELAKETMAGNP